MNELLPRERTFYQLQNLIESRSGRTVEMLLNRNQVSYVTFEEITAGGRIRLRLQRAFLRAPEEVLLALARWVGSCRGRCPRAVSRFIEEHAGFVADKPPTVRSTYFPDQVRGPIPEYPEPYETWDGKSMA